MRAIKNHTFLYVEQRLSGNQYQVRTATVSQLVGKIKDVKLERVVTWEYNPVDPRAKGFGDIYVDGVQFVWKPYTVTFRTAPELYTYIKVTQWDFTRTIPKVTSCTLYTKHWVRKPLRLCTIEDIQPPERHESDTESDTESGSAPAVNSARRYTFVVEDSLNYLVQLNAPSNDPIYHQFRIGDRILCDVDATAIWEKNGYSYGMTSLKDVKHVESVGMHPPAAVSHPYLAAMSTWLKNPLTPLNIDGVSADLGDATEYIRGKLNGNLPSNWINLRIGESNLSTLCECIDQGNVCALAMRPDVLNARPYAVLREDEEGKIDEDDATVDLRLSLMEAIYQFRQFYISKATHVFRLYDFANGLMTTHEPLSVYTLKDDDYMELLVWKFRDDVLCDTDDRNASDVYVLADGRQLKAGGKYNGMFSKQPSDTLNELKIAYTSFSAMELTNIIQLQFFSQRILSKGSLYRHDVRCFATDDDPESNTILWRMCRGLLRKFNTDFWSTRSESGPVAGETTDGVVYRFVDHKLFAYKFVTVRGSRSSHAMALMLHSNANGMKWCAFDVNRITKLEHSVPWHNKTPDAQSLVVHKTTGNGLCMIYTYICMELYLLCATMWEKLSDGDHIPTGMMTSRAVLHQWLRNTKIADLDVFDTFFDKFPETPENTVVERRANWKDTITYTIERRTNADYDAAFAKFVDGKDFSSIPPQTLFPSHTQSSDDEDEDDEDEDEDDNDETDRPKQRKRQRTQDHDPTFTDAIFKLKTENDLRRESKTSSSDKKHRRQLHVDGVQIIPTQRHQRPPPNKPSHSKSKLSPLRTHRTPQKGEKQNLRVDGDKLPLIPPQHGSRGESKAHGPRKESNRPRRGTNTDGRTPTLPTIRRMKDTPLRF